MLKKIIMTEEFRREKWSAWTISVPDNMDDDTIRELITDLYWNQELECRHKEDYCDDDPTIQVEPVTQEASIDFTLSEDGNMEWHYGRTRSAVGVHDRQASGGTESQRA